MPFVTVPSAIRLAFPATIFDSNRKSGFCPAEIRTSGFRLAASSSGLKVSVQCIEKYCSFDAIGNRGVSVVVVVAVVAVLLRPLPVNDTHNQSLSLLKPMYLGT